MNSYRVPGVQPLTTAELKAERRLAKKPPYKKPPKPVKEKPKWNGVMPPGRTPPAGKYSPAGLARKAGCDPATVRKAISRKALKANVEKAPNGQWLWVIEAADGDRWLREWQRRKK